MIVETIKGITKGGAHVSMDALGSENTCFNSIAHDYEKRQTHSSWFDDRKS